MSRHTRRTFLKAAAAGGLATTLAIPKTRVFGDPIGANDKIRLGVAGIHGRGSSHIGAFAKMDDVDVTYLIDPDSRLFGGRIKQVEQQGGNTPKTVQDIREALEDKDLDAVSVATCNHWHSLITFWACQAGKDVYVEKPCSHNVFEGRQCVKASRKYNRIVQHGTQSRGSSSWAKTAAVIASGAYGKLLVSKGYCCKPRWSIGFKPIEDPPKELDFDIWLGPAPLQPYHGNLVHYNWHWFWDTGNGDVGNQGVHQMDIARWGIPDGTLPKSVVAMGGRWVNGENFEDQGQTPNMQVVCMDFGGPLLLFETRGLVDKTVAPGNKKFPRKVDNEFYLEEGAIIGGKFYPKGSDKAEPLVDVEFKMPPGDIFSNFIHCMRTRNRDEQHADIETAHYSAALCHLGNISYRLGQQVPGNLKASGFPDNEIVQDSLQTLRDNVKGALGLDLNETTYQLGPKLEFDAEKEKFVGNREADKLLTREYRKPYVVTEEV